MLCHMITALFQVIFVMLLYVVGDKLMWFQENLDMDKATYTKADACKLVEQ